MNPTAYNFFDFYRKWSFAHSVINILLFGITLFTGSHHVWIAAVAFSFSCFVYKMPSYIPSFPLKIGYANWITIIRLLVLISIAFMHVFLNDVVLFVAFLGVILMDGVDGIVARKFHQSTDAGEHLDMETDAFMALFLCWLHFSESKLDYWIIIPGIFKYIYSLTVGLKPQKDYPPKKVRATIAVVFFLSLTTPFILTEDIFVPMCLIAASLIMISFGLSIVSSCVNVYRGYKHFPD